MRTLTIIWLLGACLFISCNHKSPKKELANLIESRIGQVVDFPNSIYSPSTNSTKPLDFLDGKYKVVVYTEGDCGVCIANLYKWKEYIKESKTLFEGTDLIFIVYSINFPRFEYNTEKAEIILPYYYDSINQYTTVNKLDEIVLHTLLLDNNNKIKLIGSPIDNPAMQKLYTRILTQK